MKNKEEDKPYLGMKCVGVFMFMFFLDDTEVVDNNGPENQQDDQQQGDEHGDETSSSEEEYHSAPEVFDHEDDEDHGATGYTHAAERRLEPEGKEEYPVTEGEKVVSHHSLHDETELNRPMNDLSHADGGDPGGTWPHARVETRLPQPQVQREREYKPMESEPEYQKLSGTSSTDSPTAPSTSPASPTAPSAYSAIVPSAPIGIGARLKNTFRPLPVEPQEPQGILTNCSKAGTLGSMSSIESEVTSHTAMSEELLNKRSDRSLSSIPDQTPAATSDTTNDATPEETHVKLEASYKVTPEATTNVIQEGAPNITSEASELSECLQQVRREEDTRSFSIQHSEEKDKCEKDLPKVKKDAVSFINIISTVASNIVEKLIEPGFVQSPMSRPASEGTVYAPSSSVGAPHPYPAQQHAHLPCKNTPLDQRLPGARAPVQVMSESRTPGHTNRVEERVAQPIDKAVIETILSLIAGNMTNRSGVSAPMSAIVQGGPKRDGPQPEPQPRVRPPEQPPPLPASQLVQNNPKVMKILDICIGPDTSATEQSWRNLGSERGVTHTLMKYYALTPERKVSRMITEDNAFKGYTLKMLRADVEKLGLLDSLEEHEDWRKLSSERW